MTADDWASVANGMVCLTAIYALLATIVSIAEWWPTRRREERPIANQTKLKSRGPRTPPSQSTHALIRRQENDDE